jgi:D-glycero-alpha-D-manno-heptose-7-phosphate kinase
VSVFCQDEFAAHGLRPVIAEANIAFNRQKGALLSFTVRLIQNLNARLQRSLPAGHLAEEACHTEIDILKEPIGKQDQYASAFGGLNQFVFHSDGRTTVQRIFLAADTVQRLEAPCQEKAFFSELQ